MSAEDLSRLEYLPGSRETYTDLAVATLLINIFSLALPLTLMQVYDRIIPFQGTATLFWFASVCCIVLILEGIIRYARATIIAWAGAKYDYYFSCAASKHILEVNLRDFEKDGLGVHLDRINAVSILKRYEAGQRSQVLMDLPFALLFITLIAYLGGIVAIIPILVIVIFISSISFAKHRFGDARNEQAVLNDRRYNFIIELLSGLHLVKAQSFEEQMLRRYERLLGTLAGTNNQVTFWINFPANLGGALTQLALLGVIAFGAMKVISGDLTLGGLAACTLLTGRAFQPIQNAATFWLNATEAKIAKERLQSVFQLPSDLKEGIPAFPSDVDGSLEVQDVSFRYADELDYVFKDVSLRIRAGSLVGFLGKSSSGTTTLMHVLSGRLRPDKGEVYIDDYNLAEWDILSLSGRVEYIPQLGTLFEGTVLENISMFQPHYHGAALDAAAVLGLDELVSLLPHGYETRVDSQASNFLPNGLIQRICIARALVLRPRIIIFDKSAASLDNESEEVFNNLVNRLKGNTTVLLVTTHAPQLRHCDKVYELVDGKIIERDKEWL